MANDRKLKRKEKKTEPKNGQLMNIFKKKPPKASTAKSGLSEKELAEEMIKMGLKKQSQPSDEKATFVKGSGRITAGPSGIITRSAHKIEDKDTKKSEPTEKIQGHSGGAKKRYDPVTRKWVTDQGTVKTTNKGNKDTSVKGNKKRIENIDEPDQPESTRGKAPRPEKGSMGTRGTGIEKYIPLTDKEKRERARQKKRGERALKRR
jgi:hypothetical protein